MPKILTGEELIEAEARGLARDWLENELQKQGLPLPKDPNHHITALLVADPTIYDQAKIRVELKQDAITRALAIVGVEQKQADVTDLVLVF